MFGIFLQTLINIWIRLTVRKLSLKDKPWLDGPVGEGAVIGDTFCNEVARARSLKATNLSTGGLLTDFSTLISLMTPMGRK